ncbi:PAS domain-containing sensor histidine kinase [Rhodanobacter sp. Root480]|uniref:phosphate regulon sensor histidine kinase PhoR n=1 Tax=Rhodanobacter sp. Root480 TaxID=1736542 RepID=UPI0006F51C8F|nr:phosphate regulon sensor histidine kinase PhoR [Rhodanobacter sp. Root480]KQX99082.1 PAS domain-containing sensor histidine kinase [Rhodanobacter sp. Root480]
MPSTKPFWQLPALLLAGLVAGALVGWLAGGRVMTGIALVAIAEILVLLIYIRRSTQTTTTVDVSAPRKSRLLASHLRDLHATARQWPDAVVILDKDQRIRWFNRAAETLLGLHRPTDRAVRWPERMAGTELAACLDPGSSGLPYEVTAPGQPESQLSVDLLPFGDQQQLLLARDVSHISRLEQIRRDFVANVSHELRTPLTVIHGYLELLDPEDVPELAPVLTEMRSQSRRMGQIVEDLLTLSRLETQHEVTDERVPMAALLAIVHKEALALSQGRHQIALESTAGMDLLGSPRDLHSALSNLVSNAVRYTPKGGSITIRWQRTPEGALYSVSDTGFGIPAAHLARLTERFYRVSSSRSRESGGTGLGLSIVKHVLNLHQARLQIDSTPGVGSTFVCHFGRARLLPPEHA